MSEHLSQVTDPVSGTHVAIAAESREREVEAETLCHAFRRAGFAAEAFTSGSPRKRFDRARKADPAILISLDVRDGVPTGSLKPMREDYERAAEAGALFDSCGMADS